MVQKIHSWGVIWVKSNRPQAGHLSEKKMTTQLSSIKMYMATTIYLQQQTQGMYENVVLFTMSRRSFMVEYEILPSWILETRVSQKKEQQKVSHLCLKYCICGPNYLLATRSETDYGGFHLHLLVFPSVYQFNSRIQVLVQSFLQMTSSEGFQQHFSILSNLFVVFILGCVAAKAYVIGCFFFTRKWSHDHTKIQRF